MNLSGHKVRFATYTCKILEAVVDTRHYTEQCLCYQERNSAHTIVLNSDIHATHADTRYLEDNKHNTWLYS